VINAIKFAIEEIEASDQYFDHTRSRGPISVQGGAYGDPQQETS
jgi:hypothetical protein